MTSLLNLVGVVATVLLVLTVAPRIALGQAFVHPGVFHTLASLDRMKAMVAAGAEPYSTGVILLGLSVACFRRRPRLDFDRKSSSAHQFGKRWGDRARRPVDL